MVEVNDCTRFFLSVVRHSQILFAFMWNTVSFETTSWPTIHKNKHIWMGKQRKKECWGEVKFSPNTIIFHLPNSWQVHCIQAIAFTLKKKNLVYSTFKHKLFQFYYSNKSNGLLILCFPLSPGITFCQGCICCVCRILCITQNFLDTYKTEALWL